MKVFDIDLQPVTKEVPELIDNLVKSNKTNLVFTPNPEILLDASEDNDFKETLKQADLLFPDWIWLYLAYLILDNPYNKIINIFLLPYFILKIILFKKSLFKKYGKKICGSDFTRECIEYANDNSLWVFILDLYNPTDEKKVKSQKDLIPKLQKLYPNIKWYLEIYQEENYDKVVKNISESQASFCFATLWVKKQESLLLKLKPHMKNIKIAAWIWSSIDYLIWFQFRAPSWMQKAWLEWLYRLYTSPNKKRQLFKIWRALVLFPIAVINSKK